MEKTIFANATGGIQQAISLYRISGNQCFDVLYPSLCFSNFKKKPDLSKIIPRHAYFVELMDDQTMIDQAVCIFYPAPNSYTGENMIELSVHGSTVVQKLLTQFFIKIGMELALPGEFTKRALLNNKMDLIQVQAMANLINAKSKISHEMALLNLEKRFSIRIKSLQKRLLKVLGYYEALLDYPEEEESQINDRETENIEELEKIITESEEILENSNTGKLINQGLQIILIGATNTGKSSLFNLLLQEDRSIVSDIHGTTRDYLDGYITLEGIPIKIYDTAGLRDSKNIIEKMGMQRIMPLIEKSDLIFFLFELDEPFSANTLKILQKYKDKTIYFVSKSDLFPEINRETIKNRPFYRMLTDNIEGFNPDLLYFVSSTEGGNETIQTINSLIKKLYFEHENPSVNLPFIQSEREQYCMQSLVKSLNNALDLIKNNNYTDMIAQEISIGLRNIVELTGEDYNRVLYDSLFSNFCLGK